MERKGEKMTAVLMCVSSLVLMVLGGVLADWHVAAEKKAMAAAVLAVKMGE